jgi:tRNA threonylcarbamoyladenosine biosynthesis protein TsaE
MRWTTHTEEETRALGAVLARELAPDGVLLLSGDLGAGKTVLARGVAEGLGIDPDEVQSPTFSLIREHRGNRGRLVHVDLYRLEPEEAGALGLEELLAGPGVKVVEWAERLPFPVPGARLLCLARRPEGGREISEEKSLEPGGFNEDS